MRPEDVKKLYDDAYASDYEARFLTSQLTTPDTEHELKLLRGLLNPGSTWLDVACGTGFFLRHFPEIERRGIDLSPGMIKAAQRCNPGVEIREHDFRNPIPEWTNAFDVVSCMWYAYCLVDTIAEVTRVIANLSDWTSPTGACFVPLADPTLIAGVRIPNERDSGFPGALKITGILWSYSEDDGTKEHVNLVAPQAAIMVDAFKQHFDQVEVVVYPPAVPGWPGRTALVAKGKRSGTGSRATEAQP